MTFYACHYSFACSPAYTLRYGITFYTFSSPTRTPPDVRPSPLPPPLSAYHSDRAHAPLQQLLSVHISKAAFGMSTTTSCSRKRSWLYAATSVLRISLVLFYHSRLLLQISLKIFLLRDTIRFIAFTRSYYIRVSVYKITDKK